MNFGSAENSKPRHQSPGRIFWLIFSEVCGIGLAMINSKFELTAPSECGRTRKSGGGPRKKIVEFCRFRCRIQKIEPKKQQTRPAKPPEVHAWPWACRDGVTKGRVHPQSKVVTLRCAHGHHTAMPSGPSCPFYCVCRDLQLTPVAQRLKSVLSYRTSTPQRG